MTWSLRNQMLLPLVVLTAILVFIASFDRAALQIKHEGERAVQTYVDVANQLATTLPEQWQSRVEAASRQFPGWNFVVVDQGRVQVSTLTLLPRQQEILTRMPPALHTEAGYDELLIGASGRWYYVIPIVVSGWPAGSYLVCLEPYQSIAATITGTFRKWSWIAFAVSCLLILAAAFYSRSLSRRVVHIQQQVQRIAAGDLSQMADERGRDEISGLARSVNVMASDLDSMKKLVQQAERSRLHAQLAGGVAHELRNGVHAARLSLEVFQENCNAQGLSSSTMLDNAIQQLDVTEALVRRLLTLGSPDHRHLQARPLREILSDAHLMIAPISRHAEVSFQMEKDDSINWVAQDAESFQAALVNLGLNAIEAAGRYGTVKLSALRHGDREFQIQVRDSGPGPDREVAETLFEPFVTTKLEGIGLGLVLVRQAVTQEGGTVTWFREQNQTVFQVTLPLETT